MGYRDSETAVPRDRTKWKNDSQREIQRDRQSERDREIRDREKP